MTTYSQLYQSLLDQTKSGASKAARLILAAISQAPFDIGKYRQFAYEVSAGDFHFIKENSTDRPVMVKVPLE